MRSIRSDSAQVGNLHSGRELLPYLLDADLVGAKRTEVNAECIHNLDNPYRYFMQKDYTIMQS